MHTGSASRARRKLAAGRAAGAPQACSADFGELRRAQPGAHSAAHSVARGPVLSDARERPAGACSARAGGLPGHCRPSHLAPIWPRQAPSGLRSARRVPARAHLVFRAGSQVLGRGGACRAAHVHGTSSRQECAAKCAAQERRAGERETVDGNVRGELGEKARDEVSEKVSEKVGGDRRPRAARAGAHATRARALCSRLARHATTSFDESRCFRGTPGTLSAFHFALPPALESCSFSPCASSARSVEQLNGIGLAELAPGRLLQTFEEVAARDAWPWRHRCGSRGQPRAWPRCAHLCALAISPAGPSATSWPSPLAGPQSPPRAIRRRSLHAHA